MDWSLVKCEAQNGSWDLNENKPYVCTLLEMTIKESGNVPHTRLHYWTREIISSKMFICLIVHVKISSSIHFPSIVNHQWVISRLLTSVIWPTDCLHRHVQGQLDVMACLNVNNGSLFTSYRRSNSVRTINLRLWWKPTILLRCSNDFLRFSLEPSDWMFVGFIWNYLPNQQMNWVVYGIWSKQGQGRISEIVFFFSVVNIVWSIFYRYFISKNKKYTWRQRLTHYAVGKFDLFPIIFLSNLVAYPFPPSSRLSTIRHRSQTTTSFQSVAHV